MALTAIARLPPTRPSPGPRRTVEVGGLEALAAEVRALGLPARSEHGRHDLVEIAEVLDPLLARVARGRGAVELALGSRLDALGTAGRELRLGFSGIEDVSRERLGIAPGTARELAGFARALRTRPLLAAAVRAGELHRKAAEAVMPLAVGPDEAAWVERARHGTVRALRAAVDEARGVARPPDDERWRVVDQPLPPEIGDAVETAMEFAGVLLGPTSTQAERVEAIATEYLATFPAEPPAANEPCGDDWSGAVAAVGEVEPRDEGDVSAASNVRRARATGDWSFLFPPPAAEVIDLRAWLEQTSRRWSFLVEVVPVAAPTMPSEGRTFPDPYVLQEELKALAALLHGWDELLGVLAHLALTFGVWRTAMFLSWEHYCIERLGLARSTVDQRVSLERRMQRLPPLREALRSGALSYEQAREVSRIADGGTAAAWIERAGGMTCIALKRAVDEGLASQMCSADGRPVRLRVRVPERVESLLQDAFRAARLRAGRWLTPAECLLELSLHFVRTWYPEVRRILGRTDRVILRDRGLCQVPGCSRPSAQVHHVRFRSAGGPEEEWNEVGLCIPHHLGGVHAGNVRVTGRAPDGLAWVLGEREVAASRR